MVWTVNLTVAVKQTRLNFVTKNADLVNAYLVLLVRTALIVSSK